MRSDFTIRKGYNKLLKISKDIEFNDSEIAYTVKYNAVDLIGSIYNRHESY